eukprot:scaffold36447_cov18-Tisochrysis_lutea.AAC.5
MNEFDHLKGHCCTECVAPQSSADGFCVKLRISPVRPCARLYVKAFCLTRLILSSILEVVEGRSKKCDGMNAPVLLAE